MKELDNLISKFNQNQKLIIGIVIPILLIIICIPIAESVSWDAGHGFRYAGSDPFRSNTWYIWLVAFTLIGFVEFKLFGNSTSK